MTPEEKKLIKARKLVAAVNRLAKKQGLNFFIVTDGASGISNNGNPAVRNAREAQIKWELEHGADQYEDWSKKAQAYDRKKWPDYEKYQKKHHDEIVAKVERIIREHFAKMHPWAIKTKDGKFIQKKDLTEDDIKDAIVRTGKAALRARRGVCHDLANARYKMLKDRGIDVSRLFVDWEDAHANDGLLGHSMVFFRGADGKYHYGNPHMAEKSRNAFGEFDDLTDAVRQYIATIKSDGGLNDEEPFTVYDTSDVDYPEIVPYTEYADLSRKGKRIMEQGHEKKAQAYESEQDQFGVEFSKKELDALANAFGYDERNAAVEKARTGHSGKKYRVVTRAYTPESIVDSGIYSKEQLGEIGRGRSILKLLVTLALKSKLPRAKVDKAFRNAFDDINQPVQVILDKPDIATRTPEEVQFFFAGKNPWGRDFSYSGEGPGQYMLPTVHYDSRTKEELKKLIRKTIREWKAYGLDTSYDERSLDRLEKVAAETQESRLYTYLPKENTVDTDGILATALTDDGWKKYQGRTKMKNKEAVLRILDALEPDWKRSMAISALEQPIPEDAAEDLVQFAKDNKLYSFDLNDLINAGIVRHIRETNNKKGTHEVSGISKHDIDWKRKPGKLLFTGIPHYMIETEDGKIPSEFVKEVQ